MPSIQERIVQFLSDANDAPPYGYQDNTVTGIGFWMMQGARIAISVYRKGERSNVYGEQLIQKASAVFIGTITLPLTLTGALMKGIGSQFLHKVENLTSDKIPCTSPAKIDQIYDLLQAIDALLRDSNIHYSMDGGTLLGAVREKGIIRWDDDGDLLILDKDQTKFLNLKESLSAQGIILQTGGMDSYKLTFDEKTLRQRYGVSLNEAANIDVFIMTEDIDGKYRYKSDFFKHMFPTEWFHKQELDQLQDFPFGPPEKGLFLKGPVQPMRYLKTFYGPECFEYALHTHSHIQIGPFAFPILNFSKTRYKIDNPTYAEGHIWKKSPQGSI